LRNASAGKSIEESMAVASLLHGTLGRGLVGIETID
jgi:hypothetical protein